MCFSTCTVAATYCFPVKQELGLVWFATSQIVFTWPKLRCDYIFFFSLEVQSCVKRCDFLLPFRLPAGCLSPCLLVWVSWVYLFMIFLNVCAITFVPSALFLIILYFLLHLWQLGIDKSWKFPPDLLLSSCLISLGSVNHVQSLKNATYSCFFALNDHVNRF